MYLLFVRSCLFTVLCPGVVSTRPLLGEEGSGDEASPGLAPLLALSCYLPLPFTLICISKIQNVHPFSPDRITLVKFLSFSTFTIAVFIVFHLHDCSVCVPKWESLGMRLLILILSLSTFTIAVFCVPKWESGY